MNNTSTIFAVVLIVVIVGAVLGLIFSRRQRSAQLQKQFGSEYDRTVKVMGNEKKAQVELNERQRYVKALEIHPLTASEHERYQSDWAAVQSDFVDAPGQAIIAADRLIMEVMQVRGYPISDFEQRAADISISYPNLVTNYRAAKKIAHENEMVQADTEDLRQALIYYRSLFEELLVTKTRALSEK